METSYEMASIIDLAGKARNLDYAFWIGNGKHYPKNPPASLTAYRDSLYDIPEWLVSLPTLLLLALRMEMGLAWGSFLTTLSCLQKVCLNLILFVSIEVIMSDNEED